MLHFGLLWRPLDRCRFQYIPTCVWVTLHWVTIPVPIDLVKQTRLVSPATSSRAPKSARSLARCALYHDSTLLHRHRLWHHSRIAYWLMWRWWNDVDQILGVWFVSRWQAAGCPGSMRVIELGPGRGTLMADILRVSSDESYNSILTEVCFSTDDEMMFNRLSSLSRLVQLRWKLSTSSKTVSSCESFSKQVSLLS